MSYAPLVAFPAAAAYLAFVAWRVRVEGGRVVRELTPLERLGAAFREMASAIERALAPVVVGATEAFRVWQEAYGAALEAVAESVMICDPYDRHEGDTK